MASPATHYIFLKRGASGYRARKPACLIVDSTWRPELPWRLALAATVAAVMCACVLRARPAPPVAQCGGSQAANCAVLPVEVENDRWMIPVTLNGVATRAVISTGSSMVTLGIDQARYFGLNPNDLIFTSTVSTPAGDMAGATTRMNLSAAGYSVEDVPVAVVNARLDHPIVGLSFLTKISPEVKNGIVFLRDK
jgi:clan AA aspartic protease (TIGR02281 family)